MTDDLAQLSAPAQHLHLPAQSTEAVQREALFLRVFESLVIHEERLVAKLEEMATGALDVARQAFEDRSDMLERLRALERERDTLRAECDAARAENHVATGEMRNDALGVLLDHGMHLLGQATPPASIKDLVDSMTPEQRTEAFTAMQEAVK